jgi:hypothetical protein
VKMSDHSPDWNPVSTHDLVALSYTWRSWNVVSVFVASRLTNACRCWQDVLACSYANGNAKF